MRIDIRPNLDQIRFFANSAMHAFDFQSPENARADVIADMEALLEYLAAFDDGNGIAVSSIAKIEGGITLKAFDRQGDILHLRHGEARANVASHPGNRNRAIGTGIEDIGLKVDAQPADERKRDLSFQSDRGSDQ
jgi:hypothetical protein